MAQAGANDSFSANTEGGRRLGQGATEDEYREEFKKRRISKRYINRKLISFISFHGTRDKCTEWLQGDLNRGDEKTKGGGDGEEPPEISEFEILGCMKQLANSKVLCSFFLLQKYKNKYKKNKTKKEIADQGNFGCDV